MKISWDETELQPLVERIVTSTLERIDADRQHVGNKLAYTDPEAAALLAIRPHVLRDARLRGEIAASRVGKRVLYEREELLNFLRRRRGV